MFDFNYIWALITVGMVAKYTNDGTLETKKDFIEMCFMGGEL